MSAHEAVPDVLGWVTDALQSASSVGDATLGMQEVQAAPEDLFREAAPLLRLIGGFDAMAFVGVEDDGVTFRVAAADPPHRLTEAETEIRRQVASGMFAWSLYQRRPVVVAGEAMGRWIVLHVVATPSRVLGMFVASHQESSAFQSAIAQQLLSVALARMATVLETRQLYHELAAYNARLEALVEERTRELRRSEGEARAASRAKGDFLANMSHEIRTPIHGIMGFTRMLLEADLDPESRERAEVVLRTADSLLAIVNDLLDYAKVEAGRLDLERARFDLRQQLEDVVELVAPRVSGAPVELVLDYGADVPRHLVGDAGRIRQVVLNLVANAVRFTRRGHVLVRVRPGEGGGIDISVEDTGIGIPPHRVEAMFEKFAQGEAGAGAGERGTGLGLSIARTLARLMDGDVTAVSTPGEGSTFTFSLPFAESPEEEGPSEKLLADVRAAVVTESPLLGAALINALHRRGADAVTMEVAEVAGLMTGGGPLPEVVLVDGALGSRALLRVARMVRAGRSVPPPRLWALLHEGGDAREAGLREAGYEGWIPKPVREARMVAVLRPGRVPPEGRSRQAVPAFPGTRVLFAEDDEVSRRLGVFMLERMGCRVTAVGNGVEAVSAAWKRPFDLVVLDGAMPEMDGYEAARAMRAMEGLAATPIIALTASAAPGDRSRALEAGMDDHVPKPVSPEQLARVMARLLPDAEAPDEDLDVEEALRKVGGDRGFLDSQIRLFLDGWPCLRRDIFDACGRQDAAQLRALAHRLKGGAGSLAAPRLAWLAEAIERGSARECSPEALAAVQRLDGAVEDMRAKAGALEGSGEAA